MSTPNNNNNKKRSHIGSPGSSLQEFHVRFLDQPEDASRRTRVYALFCAPLKHQVQVRCTRHLVQKMTVHTLRIPPAYQTESDARHVWLQLFVFVESLQPRGQWDLVAPERYPVSMWSAWATLRLPQLFQSSKLALALENSVVATSPEYRALLVHHMSAFTTDNMLKQFEFIRSTPLPDSKGDKSALKPAPPALATYTHLSRHTHVFYWAYFFVPHRPLSEMDAFGVERYLRSTLRLYEHLYAHEQRDRQTRLAILQSVMAHRAYSSLYTSDVVLHLGTRKPLTEKGTEEKPIPLSFARSLTKRAGDCEDFSDEQYELFWLMSYHREGIFREYWDLLEQYTFAFVITQIEFSMDKHTRTLLELGDTTKQTWHCTGALIPRDPMEGEHARLAESIIRSDGEPEHEYRTRSAVQHEACQIRTTPGVARLFRYPDFAYLCVPEATRRCAEKEAVPVLFRPRRAPAPLLETLSRVTSLHSLWDSQQWIPVTIDRHTYDRHLTWADTFLPKGVVCTRLSVWGACTRC